MLKNQYPIGKFVYNPDISLEKVKENIETIASLPQRLKGFTSNISEADLEKTYREGSWTVRQLLHHLPDSHTNGYIRMKLALTEEMPVIKPYNEEEWAKLADVKAVPVFISLNLLEAVHERWTMLMRKLTEEQLNRKYMHPESGETDIKNHIASYAWHGEHHLAHIKLALAEGK